MPPVNRRPVIKDEVVGDISGNRRSKQRFKIDLPLTYKIAREHLGTATGNGRTVDMSSSGIAFTADETFKIDAHVELSVIWPVLLNGSCPMKLVVEGEVVRCDGSFTAIRMHKYEFHTQGRSVT